ncbi:hypothetical protein Hdeb2414_s0025g00658371 [Helianthus debilis subsp. tardiflorus]
MPPRFWRGRGKGPVTGNDHEARPSHRRTPSITMSTSPQEPWRVYVEPGRRLVSLSSSPSYLHSFGPQSENEPDNHPPPSFIPLQRSNSHHSFGDPTPAFQSRFNPSNFIQEPVGFNPLGPEDHFSGENDMDEDTDPMELATGTSNHPPMGHLFMDHLTVVLTTMRRGSGRLTGISLPHTTRLHTSSSSRTAAGSFRGSSICGSHSATTTTSGTATASGATEAEEVNRTDVRARRSPHQHSSALEWQSLPATPRRRRPTDGESIKPHPRDQLCTYGATIGFR